MWTSCFSCCKSDAHSHIKLPTDSQINVAFKRWKERSNALNRFPYVDEETLAAYIRDDEELRSFIEPKHGVNSGLSEEDMLSMTKEEIRVIKEKAKRRVHNKYSKIISKRLFQKWWSLWTPYVLMFEYNYITHSINTRMFRTQIRLCHEKILT